MHQSTLIFGLLLASLINTTNSWAETSFKGDVQSYQSANSRFAPPPVSFLDAEDKPHFLTDYPDQVLIVNLWASWCRTCLAEMASLQRLQQQLGTNARLLTLNQDLNDSAQIQQLLHRLNAGQLPAHRDIDGRLGFAMGQTLLPTTIFIDAQGRISGQLIGPAKWDSPEALALINSLHL